MQEQQTHQTLSPSLLMRDVIQRVAVGPDRGRDISRSEAAAVMQAILAGQLDEVQVAVFLIALRMKRESLEEFQGLFDSMQASCEVACVPVPQLWCLADPFDGYLRHISMTAFLPPLLAACGLPTVMHGVETVGPKHGMTSHKVYKLAGIEVECKPSVVAQTVSETAWGYLDQRSYAPDLAVLSDLRDRLVKRTAITTLERLLMPLKGSRHTHMVLGYVHKAYPEIYATIAQQAGYSTTLLLKGVEGGLSPALNKPLRRFFYSDQTANINDVEKELLESAELFDQASAMMSADGIASQALTLRTLEIGLQVLHGRRDGVELARDSLLLSAANILFAHRHADSLAEAVEKARVNLDNGSANNHFQSLANQ